MTAPFAPLASPPPDRLRDLLTRFSGVRLLVVGDVMLDRFVIGRVRRISPEAPVPVVEFDRDEDRVGGAANVASNARALGAQIDLAGLVGRDDEAARLGEELKARGIGTAGLVVDPDRRTTLKLRIVTDRNQQVARVDYEADGDAAGGVERSLIDAVERAAASADAIVVSDYLKGCVTRALVASLADVARARGVALLVDPKVPHIDFYRGARLVTPNHHEAEIATNLRIRSNEEAGRAARAFRERAGCEGVLVTRGEHGMWLLDGSVEGPLPAAAREVSDVTGAGDTVIAAIALSVAAGATMAEAAAIANHAAGVAVGRFGPATVSREELAGALGVAI